MLSTASMSATWMWRSMCKYLSFIYRIYNCLLFLYRRGFLSLLWPLWIEQWSHCHRICCIDIYSISKSFRISLERHTLNRHAFCERWMRCMVRAREKIESKEGRVCGKASNTNIISVQIIMLELSALSCERHNGAGKCAPGIYECGWTLNIEQLYVPHTMIRTHQIPLTNTESDASLAHVRNDPIFFFFLSLHRYFAIRRKLSNVFHLDGLRLLPSARQARGTHFSDERNCRQCCGPSKSFAIWILIFFPISSNPFLQGP